MISVTVSTHRFNNVNPFSLALLNYNHTPPAEQRKYQTFKISMNQDHMVKKREKTQVENFNL